MSIRQSILTIKDKLDRESLGEKLDPDCPSGTTYTLIGFAVAEIICVLVKLGIRFSAIESIDKAALNTMLLVDALKYTVLFARNLQVNRWLCTSHAESPNAHAFTAKNRLYDSTLGRQGEIVLELFMLMTVGTVFQAMSFRQLASSTEYNAGILVVAAIAAQGLNMLSLVALCSIVDNSHIRIKTICQFLQLGQVVELVYDIAMHVIYTMGDSQGLKGVGNVPTAGSNSYHDLRLAGLVALISARLIAQRFFGFKARLPLNIYCEVLHEKVPNIADPDAPVGRTAAPQAISDMEGVPE